MNILAIIMIMAGAFILGACFTDGVLLIGWIGMLLLSYGSMADPFGIFHKGE